MLIAVACAAAPLSAVKQGLLVNRTSETRRLGLARAAFFKEIIKVSQPHEDVDYSGYRSMLMVDHTTMLWPIGRADEVIFVYGSAGHFLLTQWRRQNGVPKRLFQIAYVPGARAFPYGGTLCTFLGKVGARVPKRYAKPLKSLLQARQGYATYFGQAAIGLYYCEVLREDGSGWPGRNVAPEDVPAQDDQKVDKDGFAITVEEQRLIAAMRHP